MLIAVSPFYGYHRDELYFLAAARHPDFGYPDQPPLTPLLAGMVQLVAPNSLIALRLPVAIAAGVVVLLTAALAREMRAAQSGQILAASCAGFAVTTMIVFHLFSTTAFDILFWTLVSWLVIRQLDGADPRGWLLVGVTVGLALENKTLPLFLVGALLVGLLIAGPRRVLTSPWVAGAVAIAAALWAPDLIWQGLHGWPQLAVSRSIAAGSSATSQPWYLFLPFQLILYSPLYLPIWVAGLLRLFRGRDLPRLRCFGWAYVVLLIVFSLTGGKPYYMAGIYPVLFAAGAQPVVDWLVEGWGRRAAQATTVAMVGGSAAAAAVLALPLLPVTALDGSPLAAVNADIGETVGWPVLVDTVAEVYRTVPAGTVILTANYGEAGAIDLYGPAALLPEPFSGHNGFGLWGPPPDSETVGAVVVGHTSAQLQQWFGTCERRATVDNTVDLDNEEQGAVVWFCTDQLAPWSALWPDIRRLG